MRHSVTKRILRIVHYIILKDKYGLIIEMIRRDDTESIIRQGLKANDLPSENPGSGSGASYGKVEINNQDLKRFKKRTIFHRVLGSGTTPVDMQDQFRGYLEYKTPVFLILGGPSLNKLDLASLADSGILTMGVNNNWSIYTPDFWTCVDPPRKFLFSGWSDPSITKFVPANCSRKALRQKTGDRFHELDLTPSDCPNTIFYQRNSSFDHQTFLLEDTVNWGNTTKSIDSLGFKSCRSVMLAAIKILFVLGFRRIYLLGCDFKMEPFGDNYAFDQDRTTHSVKGNNRSYKTLNERFKAMRPYFEYNGLEVLNCNPNSDLEAFDHVDFSKALSLEESLMVQGETTHGWYEGEKKDKEKRKHRKQRALK